MLRYLRYLIFITIGILLYLLLNRYNTFSIGAILRIPLGTSLVLDQIDFTHSENVPHTPRAPRPLLSRRGKYTYQPINQIYMVDGQYYYYTDINMQEIMYGTYDDSLIETINLEIERLERERLERERLERERLERLERERLERERLERLERERQQRFDFLTQMQQRDDNTFRENDIIIYNDRGDVYTELDVTMFNPRDAIGGAAGGGAAGGGAAGGGAVRGMSGNLIQLPDDLPGYVGNPNRMYFVVRPITILNTGFFGRTTTTTTYRIVGFGGHNENPNGRYIQDLIDLGRFVPIQMMQIGINEFHRAANVGQPNQLRDLLDILQINFNERHNTTLEITDYIRWFIYQQRDAEHCAVMVEGTLGGAR